MLTPKLQVSFSISSIQKMHQTLKANNIKFAHFSKWGFTLASIIAIANKIICKSSFGSDMGTGTVTSFIWMK
jgi:hypothetical protein